MDALLIGIERQHGQEVRGIVSLHQVKVDEVCFFYFIKNFA
jgi:hypothetical protein